LLGNSEKTASILAMKNYLKDIVRLGSTSAASAGVVVGTSNNLERALSFAIIGFTLVTSFLFDSKDPRNHARAIKLLGLEGKVQAIVHIGAANVPTNSAVQQVVQATDQALEHSQVDVENDSVKLDIADLVKTEVPVLDDAKPAVNGVPLASKAVDSAITNGGTAIQP
jgi:hypothetical protein